MIVERENAEARKEQVEQVWSRFGYFGTVCAHNYSREEYVGRRRWDELEEACNTVGWFLTSYHAHDSIWEQLEGSCWSSGLSRLLQMIEFDQLVSVLEYPQTD